MELLLQETRKKLENEIDLGYQEFNRSLIPGETSRILGVRIPVLRKIAKELVKTSGRSYADAVVLLERSKEAYYEERMIHGILIGYLKCEEEERRQLLDSFVPAIDNWSVCDSSCTTYKFMKQDMEYWFSYLEQYLNSSREYEIRFAVVCMLDHFVTDYYIGKILRDIDAVHHEGYYVKMAVAWAISVCYVKFPKETFQYLKTDHLDDFTHNKAIEKICVSYRVPKEEKEKLKEWKRKEEKKR